MITEETYFALNNKGLSQSKIKTYAKCPNYFYRSHITGEVERKSSKAFLIGTEVDSLLTEVNKAKDVFVFDGDFRSKANREMKAELEAKGTTVIKQSEYESIMAISIAVQATTIWKEIEKDFIMQEILIEPMSNLGEHFDCLYGKTDAFRIERFIDSDGKKHVHCTLLDLKTSLTVDKRAFFYKAHDLGYFKQLWMYNRLLKHAYPEITSFDYKFVVAEKSEPYKVKLFTITNEMVEAEEKGMLKLIASIAANKDFKKEDVTWEDAEELSLSDETSNWD